MSATAALDERREIAERDPRPVVTLPRQGLPGAVIAVLAAVAAIMLFVLLEARRQRLAETARAPARQQTNAFVPPPPLIVPPEPSPAISIPRTATIVTTPAPTASPAPSQLVPLPPMVQPAPAPVPATTTVLVTEQRSPRLNEPALVIDGGVQQGGASASGIQPRSSASPLREGAGASSLIGDTPARATLIGNRKTVMPVGTIIPAVLETPIDTARPGLLRAVVSEDARGFDGLAVLVTRGSRLIGEYQADVRANQNRVLVTWTRLIRSDGVTIQLGSPAADRLGGAGVPGRLHTYFLERFASAVLQSALQVGVNLASRPGNGSVIVGLPGTTVTNVVGQTLPQGDSFQPKITVKQGAAINVFVARDLDFSGVPGLPPGR